MSEGKEVVDLLEIRSWVDDVLAVIKRGTIEIVYLADGVTVLPPTRALFSIEVIYAIIDNLDRSKVLGKVEEFRFTLICSDQTKKSLRDKGVPVGNNVKVNWG